jgi:hypothetical protein
MQAGLPVVFGESFHLPGVVSAWLLGAGSGNMRTGRELDAG